MWWSKFQRSPALNAILLVAVIAVLAGAARVTYQAYQIRSEFDATQKETETLKQKKDRLEAELRELGTPEAAQREAKERLNLKLPDENVVVVVPSTTNTATSTSGNPWSRLTQFLKGIIP